MKPIHCGNCKWTGDLDGEDYTVLGHVEELETRLEPGQEVPAGECPDCGTFLYLGPKPKKQESHTVTIDDALEILNKMILDDDFPGRAALDTITQAFGGAVKQFFCPQCGGSHFGSSGCLEETMIGNCHSCRGKAFTWPRTDDDKYFRWVITLPANMIEDEKTVTGTSCEEDP